MSIDSKIEIKETINRTDDTVAINSEDRTQVLPTAANKELIDIFTEENEKGGSSLHLVTIQYYKTGELAGVYRQMLIDILKKHIETVKITPELFEKIPDALEVHMQNLKYDMARFRKRVPSL